jgi:hypothetical protein
MTVGASPETRIAGVAPPVVSGELLMSGYLGSNIGSWVPKLCEWKAVDQMANTSHNKHQPVTFEVDTIDLPTAAQRWKLSMPGHPEVTFDDLRAGRWPKLTEEELKARQSALTSARKVHDKLDIRPLRTSTIVRELRE